MNDETGRGGAMGEQHPVGRLIRRYRTELGWTQKECAEKCGVVPCQWSRWETAGPPSLRGLAKIADALCLDSEEVEAIVQEARGDA